MNTAWLPIREVSKTVRHLTRDGGRLGLKEGQEELQMDEHEVSVKRGANP